MTQKRRNIKQSSRERCKISKYEMRISVGILSSLLLSATNIENNAVLGFVTPSINTNALNIHVKSNVIVRSSDSCSCETIRSGNLSEKAKNINAKEVLSSGYVYNVDGERLSMKSLLDSSPSGVSIVVFLRSFG